MKKGKIVDLAFKLAGINSRTKNASPTETDDWLNFLEGMMNQLDGQTIRLGYVMEDTPSAETESGIPPWANDGIYSALAVRMRAFFSLPPDASLMDQARIGMNTIVSKTSTVHQINYSSRMPVGSGNNTTFRNKFFYPVDQIITGDFLEDDGGDVITT
jgi:hypothetical protein